ncbi:DUF2974 domain-containing protein [Lactobacillus sp. ESL0791]|uniref:DUF2974 domain-containing protein n=1 Tax=Lactobacillus sp. ESL0791 TaxID=2983234 RepID=UPI0023FA3B3E|nr:DUF2974 domain-containing protein [Lactobacillus sp. ESL0791]MDF7637843.1 DUF2974 domain-containing protein [Lactobacillus sp. ESL0791]
MSTTLDYLRWRGDLSFEVNPFNSVDASLLSSLVYLPADKSAINHTLGSVAEKLHDLPSFQPQMHDETGAEILLLPKSPRLANIKILDWIDRSEKEPHPLQFTAAAFRINADTIVIAYRGTDSTMIGWNEDMRMNYMPEIYGQTVATEYLNQIVKQFPNDHFYLVGHSKGGNFAQYALGTAEAEVQDRVIQALSFDGLGFYHQVYTNPNFMRVLPKMKTYIPESSIFGAMLDHPERTLVVKSDVAMRNQHDPRRWSVGRDSFTLAPGLSSSARIIRHALIHFNNSIPKDKREETFSALFEAFENFNIDDINQIIANKLLGTYRLGRIFLSLDSEQRKLLANIFSDVWKSFKNNTNLFFRDNDYDLYPKSNDSSKAPIFFEFYDSDTPNLKLPQEVWDNLYKNKNKSSD